MITGLFQDLRMQCLQFFHREADGVPINDLLQGV